MRKTPSLRGFGHFSYKENLSLSCKLLFYFLTYVSHCHDVTMYAVNTEISGT
ncbi:hypothetical protein Pint_32326 [Pistacia integerrima]|uniref:Uncharacterized protein n=1 Tax=Pistacia integerrima TaxID=434235 RepID=A0ACC0XQ56_9ROSI|nr:hypothetical protein Pint_32326 [Pistacia integerrima]